MIEKTDITNCNYVVAKLDLAEEQIRLKLVGQSLPMACHKTNKIVYVGTNDRLAEPKLKVRCLNTSCPFNSDNKQGDSLAMNA